MGWGSRVNKNEKASWASACSSLCFLATAALWPAALYRSHHVFLTHDRLYSQTVSKNKLPSWRCFCQWFFVMRKHWYNRLLRKFLMLVSQVISPNKFKYLAQGYTYIYQGQLLNRWGDHPPKLLTTMMQICVCCKEDGQVAFWGLLVLQTPPTLLHGASLFQVWYFLILCFKGKRPLLAFGDRVFSIHHT